MSSVKQERHDIEHASQSGSEDGSYALYPDANRIEGDAEDESSGSLTSQTLNADGTPKRPMNAFMIFARRRRPQVSAENQAMRTGEISKILSKEWVSMPASEKQFYLEQAKQLKDTFNSKYPDYVYRRRPNNSRRRRRETGGMRSDSAVPDALDDMGNGIDDISPTDANDHLDYSRLPHDMGHSVDSSRYGINPSRSSGHPYGHPQDPPFSSRESRGYSSSSIDRHSSGYGSSASPRLGAPSGINYSYSHPPSHVSSSSMYSNGEGSQLQGWQRSERGQSNNAWMGSANDRLAAGAIPSKGNYGSSSSWASSDTTPLAASPSTSSQNYFPTLNTPFYPSSHGPPPFQSNSATSSSHSVHHHSSSSSPPHSYEPLGSIPPNPRDYSRSYGTSSTLSSNSPYSSSSSRDPFSQRSLPPVQTSTSGYSHSQPSSSSSSGHGHTSNSFWPRD